MNLIGFFLLKNNQSSSIIRDNVKRNKNLRDLVHPGVREYIAEHHLYL